MSYDIKRSVSLYSYQDEYYDGKLDLEGCLRETAKTGATGADSHCRLKQKNSEHSGLAGLKNMVLSHHAMMHFWKTKFMTIVH